MNRFDSNWHENCEFVLMINKVEEANAAAFKKKKNGQKTKWTPEQNNLNSEVLYFIAALIGTRIKYNTKKNSLQNLYKACYTSLIEFSSNDFSCLWNNGSYDLFQHYGSRLPPTVLLYLKHWLVNKRLEDYGTARAIKVIVNIIIVIAIKYNCYYHFNKANGQMD
jgi:hypothetical protein